MKKLFLIQLFTILAVAVMAQVDHDYNPNDRIAIVNTTITKEQVPALVREAVNKQFDKSNPLTWSRFPYALKEYGWVYDVASSDIPLNRYEVTMKTDTGNDLWAVYNAKGELIETREISKNIPMPREVQIKLAGSQYKDWNIVGDKEIIKFYHDNDMTKVEQHFRITVEKNNVRRSISFNDQASVTGNK